MTAIKCVEVFVVQDNNELKKQMVPMAVSVKEDGAFWMTVGGYDNDPRDLWEIPECVNLMERLVEIGFISLLEVSSTVDDLKRDEWKGQIIPGLGAFEVWAIAQGHYQKIFARENTSENLMGQPMEGQIDMDFVKECIADLLKANERCEETVRAIAAEGISNNFGGDSPHVVINPPFGRFRI